MEYNDKKDFEGKTYTGMQIGNGHLWDYTDCKVREWKTTPYTWKFSLNAIKKRLGGWKDKRFWKANNNRKITKNEAPLGSKYKWLHIGIQDVVKTEPDAYEMIWNTEKYKLDPINNWQKKEISRMLIEETERYINKYCRV